MRPQPGLAALKLLRLELPAQSCFLNSWRAAAPPLLLMLLLQVDGGQASRRQRGYNVVVWGSAAAMFCLGCGCGRFC